MPLFLHDDRRLLLPTARRIWDELLSAAVVIRGYLEGDEARRIFDRLMEAAEAHGSPSIRSSWHCTGSGSSASGTRVSMPLRRAAALLSGSAYQQYVITGLPIWSGRNMPGGADQAQGTGESGPGAAAAAPPGRRDVQWIIGARTYSESLPHRLRV